MPVSQKLYPSLLQWLPGVANACGEGINRGHLEPVRQATAKGEISVCYQA